MKIIVPSFILTLVVILFFTQKETQKSNLRVINVMETYLVKDSLKLLENDSSGFNIAYANGFEVYEEPILQYVTDSVKKIDGVITNIGHESKDTLFNYFVTKKGMDKVFLYETIDSKDFKIIDHDSLLRKFNIDSANNTSLNLELGIPNQTIRNKKTNAIEAEHFIKKNPGEGYADTISRYYDVRLKDIDFSYSPVLDKEKKSKLVITRFITLPRPVKQKDGSIKMSPYISDSSMIRAARTKREAIYLALIERFKKDIKTVK